MAWLNKAFKETAYYRTIEAIDPDERLLCVVKQHPFGIMTIYILAIVAFTAAIALISLLLPNVIVTSAGVYVAWVIMALVLAGALLLVLLLSSYVYNQSRLTITDKNVVQITQRSITDRKVSHLSLANVEDVTSEQTGIFPGMLNFGTVNIETAVGHPNFKFTMCPQPNRVAKIILDAKRDYLHKTGQAGSYRNNPPRNRTN
jgi:hypothetical protein